MRQLLVCAVLLGSVSSVAAQKSASSKPIIPLCEGLTIVTAIQSRNGDYESIKTIDAVDKDAVGIHYSSYMRDPRGDYDSPNPPPWVPFTVHRTVRQVDLESSERYLQYWNPTKLPESQVLKEKEKLLTATRRRAPRENRPTPAFGVPEVVRDTTAIGVSRKILRNLRDRGKTPFTIFHGFSETSTVDEDGNPSSMRLPGEIKRVDPTPVQVPVLVNNRLVNLPAIRARGRLMYSDAEFLFLLDESNPITLEFRIGIRPPPGEDEKKMWAGLENTDAYRKAFVGARDNLRVLKIAHNCDSLDLPPAELPAGSGMSGSGGGALSESGGGGGAGVGGAGGGAGGKMKGGIGADATSILSGGGGFGRSGSGGRGGRGTGSGGGAGGAGGSGSGGGGAARGGAGSVVAGGGGGTLGAQIEQSLARTGRAEVYSIYFDFNSDVIRPESEETLQEIAGIMRRHPDWKLSIEGHTDNIASDGFNLRLSERRAAAVKNALVSGKKIAAARLTTGGYGESRPKATNETVEGRALNRRVELVRTP